jgi:hypothetical protein
LGDVVGFEWGQLGSTIMGKDAIEINGLLPGANVYAV